MKKEIEPIWNVYKEDFNGKRMTVFNIFNHWAFSESIKKLFIKQRQKENLTLEDLKEKTRRELQYYFWSKCEYEIILSDWPPSQNFHKEKVDIYDQVMLNFDIFFKYLCEIFNISQ